MDPTVSHDALVNCLYGLDDKKPAKFDTTERRAKINRFFYYDVNEHVVKKLSSTQKPGNFSFIYILLQG